MYNKLPVIHSLLPKDDVADYNDQPYIVLNALHIPWKRDPEVDYANITTTYATRKEFQLPAQYKEPLAYKMNFELHPVGNSMYELFA